MNKVKQGKKRYLIFWCYKQFLISNCKRIKKLSYADKIVSIKNDIKTMPNGRLIVILAKKTTIK